MRFSWDVLQNMLENGHSNLQTNLWVHIASNIFKISNSKITGLHQPPPPTSQLWKLTLPPGVGGRFGIFPLKWRERMNLKVPGAILPLGCAILSTRAKTVTGGWYNPPLGELGLIACLDIYPVCCFRSFCSFAGPGRTWVIGDSIVAHSLRFFQRFWIL